MALAAVVACNSEQGCQFDFARDAVTYDGTPWLCALPDGVTFEIAFFADGTGNASLTGDFDWQVTSCRTLEVVPADGATGFALESVGGNVEVGRLTFVLDSETVLCGYGVPPP